jgi:murein DD-endopeptidase MepM/ murein hydrolase activator NlpD
MRRAGAWRAGGRRWLPWAAAGLAAALLAAVAVELSYGNWRPVVSPLPNHPLLVRADAKGDGAFGAPRSGGRRHRGVDLAAPLQTPVAAVRSGRVVEARADPGLGRYVVIAHRAGWQSLYAHLEEVRVREGQRVRQGEVLGIVGKTGNARHEQIMPHLHLEIVQGGAPVDPQRLGLAVASADVALSAHAGQGVRDQGLSDAGGE